MCLVLLATLSWAQVGGSPGITGGNGSLSNPAVTPGSLQITGPSPWIDVTAATYGADRTGTADSTTAINSAISACSGGTLFFPPGKYKHTAQLTLSTPCTLFAYPGTSTIFKGYSPNSGNPNGFPSAVGSVLITGSNITIDGLNYDGCFATDTFCGSTQTGPCITSASNISNITIRHSVLNNCDVVPIAFTGGSQGGTGATRVLIEENTITCSNSANSQGAIFMQETLTFFRIVNNYLDCTPATSATNGIGTIQAESQGLTTTFQGVQIIGNTIWTPSNINGSWGIQLGPFNAYAITDNLIENNLIINSNTNTNGSAFCASLEFVPNLIFSGNICDANGFAFNYTAIEIFGDNAAIVGNTFYTDQSGTGTAITLITSNNSTVTGNTIRGFGETGGGSNLASGITVGGQHGTNTISSIAFASNVMTVTTSGALQAWFQPGSMHCIVGSSTAGDNICGLMLNTGYSRTSGTFQMYNPGGGACASSCGTVNSSESNNNIADNIINLPCNGTLTSSRYGILIRPQASGEYAINNRIHDNLITGCANGSPGDVGIDVTSGAGAVIQNNDIYNNRLNNLAQGIIQNYTGTGPCCRISSPNTFSGVATAYAGSTLSSINWDSSSAVYGACTGVGTASSTLGLYGTGPNVTLTTCTSTTLGSGIPMPRTGTLAGLVATATAAGVNASSGVVTVLKNGVTTTITCTLGTGTSCQDNSHNVAYVAGDLISIQFTTQTSDTLAGVKASVAY